MAKSKGRPSKLTPETRKRLFDAIKAGCYYDVACRYAGISYATFRNWINKGEKSRSGEFFDFLEALKQAEAEAEVRMVMLWQSKMPEDWKAARDFLARRYPDRWGLKEKIDLEHSGEVVQQYDATKITEKLRRDPEFIEAIQQAYKARSRVSEDDL